MRLGLTVGLTGGSPDADEDVVRAAEHAGFDTISVGEAGLDTFAAATAVALWSRHVRVYSGIATWVRPPVLTALSAATVDRFARGRYTLGLGTMPAAWNRDFYGIDAARSLHRMGEYVAVVRGSLRAHSGAALDYDGRFFQVRGYRRPVPPERDDLPLHLAATRPGMARLAGEVADGVLFNLLHTTEWIRDVLGPAVDAAGRRVERGVMVRCAVGERTEALAMLRASLRTYLRVPYFYDVAEACGYDLAVTRQHVAAGDDAAALEAVPDELLTAMGLAGSPHDCVAQLARYADLVDWVLLAPPGVLAGDALHRQSLEIVGTFGGVRP
jgi:alkanesulfonate monooxygenase SsuD/methylene tetrahydromethanopterin reductase-like flavin-dependent oxidoreductase (luciferase family)